MRIAFVTPEFVTEEYFSGGLANYVHRLSSALAERGHHVHVLVRSSQAQETFTLGRVHIHRVLVDSPSPWVPSFVRQALNELPDGERLQLGSRNTWVPCAARRALKEPHQWLKFSWLAWRRLEALNREQAFDIVQLANYQACGLFVAMLSRIPHVTRLSSFQKIWNKAGRSRRLPGESLEEWLTESLELLQLRSGCHLFAPSRWLAAAVSAHLGSVRVDVVPSPAFIETASFDEGPFRDRLEGHQYLLFFGRYQLHKGAHILARALPAVFRALPACEAVFVGRDIESELGPSMEAYIYRCSPGFESRLHFFGETPHEQLFPIVKGARLVVLPSLVDNLPNAMLEAMSLGRPVVGTFGASFDEVIQDGKSGFLVAPGHPDELADKIIQAWNHPELDSIGEAASTIMGAFSREYVATATLEYFRRAMNERVSRSSRR